MFVQMLTFRKFKCNYNTNFYFIFYVKIFKKNITIEKKNDLVLFIDNKMCIDLIENISI